MRDKSRTFFGLILIIIGASILFNIDLWRFFWPAILIFLGVRLLQQGENGHSPRTEDWEKVETSREDKIDYSAVFWGLSKKVISDDFRGGKITAVFGGGELDLRESKIIDEAELEVNAVFGGIEIMVPEEWQVVNRISGIAGGVNNSSRTKSRAKETPRLILSGAAVLGGVDIRN